MLSLLQCQCHMMLLQQLTATNKPGIQALADILLSVLCCHSNETHAPTANPPNNAQLDGTPYHSSKLHPGLCSSVGMRRGSDTQMAVATIHFASATPHVKCNYLVPYHTVIQPVCTCIQCAQPVPNPVYHSAEWQLV